MNQVEEDERRRVILRRFSDIPLSEIGKPLDEAWLKRHMERRLEEIRRERTSARGQWAKAYWEGREDEMLRVARRSGVWIDNYYPKK